MEYHGLFIIITRYLWFHKVCRYFPNIFPITLFHYLRLRNVCFDDMFIYKNLDAKIILSIH